MHRLARTPKPAKTKHRIPHLGARWQFQEAKAKLSQVMDEVLDKGPQVIMRRGKDVAALIAIKDLPKVLVSDGKDTNRKGAILKMLLRAPKVDLDLRRSRDLPRPGPYFE